MLAAQIAGSSRSIRRASALSDRIGSSAVPVPVGGQSTGKFRETTRGRTPLEIARASSSGR